MGTQAATVEHIVQRMEGAGDVFARKMFGEYGIYFEGKMLALVCDDQLFIKPTSAGRAFLGEVEEGFPYPGSKPWFLIPEDDWDDSLRLQELLHVTWQEVPLPAPKKKKPAK